MIKKAFHSLHITGYRHYQKFFERLHHFSLGGMNIGTAAEIYDDGELAVLQYLHKKEGDIKLTLFDVGANVGHYTEALARQFGDNARIYSFEPSKKTFQTLSNTVNRNPVCKGKAILTNVGLGDKAGMTELFTDTDDSGLASVYNRRLDHFGISMNKSEKITMMTLDEFCRNNKITAIDFLKMDVEGHELSVLRGAKEMLAKKAIKYIQFEFGGNNIDSRTFFQDFYYLLKDDFNIFRVVKDGLYPIIEYKEKYECFLCTVFFAERK
jgi:FkbM family methyltransferase